ncbi:hypothetical protein ACET8U_22805 [Aeromonas veronii]
MNINPIASNQYPDFADCEVVRFGESNAIHVDVYDNITKVAWFDEGLKKYNHHVGDFRASVNQGKQEAYAFVANNVNPNKYQGMVSNFFNIFAGGSAMLNQNCVYCAKAVERNLAQMESKQIDDFYVTEKTERGSVGSPPVKEGNYVIFQPTKESLSSQLLDKTQPNSRYMIMVPAKGYGGHAMNLVRCGNDVTVIDGQFKCCYNLSDAKGRALFDKYYGVNDKTMFPVVELHRTGEMQPDIIDDDDFEVIDFDEPEQTVKMFDNKNVNPNYFA